VGELSAGLAAEAALLAFANSTFVALAVTAFRLSSALAGYALTQLKFRGKQGLLLII
jgi:multiple sugar transport system permease protein